MTIQDGCRRCGTCCKNGGPALHSEDLALIRSGKLPLDRLTTIRKGEMVLEPADQQLIPARQEFLKISGSRGTWACTYFDETAMGCRIYAHRPLGCRVLKCWDTTEILELAGKDLITRMDVISPDDPIRPLIPVHEKKVPLDRLETISKTLSRSSKKTIKTLERQCNQDLKFRNEVVADFGLSVGMEMFYFGRPLFELLTPMGIHVREVPTGVKLRFG